MVAEWLEHPVEVLKAVGSNPEMISYEKEQVIIFYHMEPRSFGFLWVNKYKKSLIFTTVHCTVND